MVGSAGTEITDGLVGSMMPIPERALCAGWTCGVRR